MSKLKLVPFLLFFLSIFCCEKETLDDAIVQPVQIEQSILEAKKISFHEAQKNLNSSDILKKITSKKNKYKSKDDFKLIDDYVTYVSNGVDEFYTFQIKRDVNENAENLILRFKKSDPDKKKHRAYIASYSLSLEERILMEKGQEVPLADKMSMQRITIDDAGRIVETRYRSTTCYEVIEKQEISRATGWEITVLNFKEIPCPEGGGIDDDNGTGTDPGGTDGGFNGGGNGGGPGGPNPNEPPQGDDDFDDGDIFTAPIVRLNIIGVLQDRLALGAHTSTEMQYLLNVASIDIVVDIFNFLEEEQWVEEAKNEATMIIMAERVNNDTEPKWNYRRTGQFANRPSLNYKAAHDPSPGETMFLLENGLVLFRSQHQRKINRDDIPETIGSTEVQTEGYNYIYNYDLKRWYEYRWPEPDYADADIDFLLSAFWTGTKIVGRYATPLEDWIILIDGKDFDGVEQERADAAGYIIIGLIPGGQLGKIAKPVTKIVSNITKYKKVVEVTVNGIKKTVNLPMTIIGGIVDFGSSSKLRKTLGMPSISLDPRQAHHLLPRADVIKTHNVIQKVAKSKYAFHIDEALNGIPVDAWRNQPNHHEYTQRVKDLLDEIDLLQSPDDIYNDLTGVISYIKNVITENPNTHLNDLAF